MRRGCAGWCSATATGSRRTTVASSTATAGGSHHLSCVHTGITTVNWLEKYGGTQGDKIDSAVDRVADVFPDEDAITKAGYSSQEESDLLAVLGPRLVESEQTASRSSLGTVPTSRKDASKFLAETRPNAPPNSRTTSIELSHSSTTCSSSPQKPAKPVS